MQLVQHTYILKQHEMYKLLKNFGLDLYKVVEKMDAVHDAEVETDRNKVVMSEDGNCATYFTRVEVIDECGNTIGHKYNFWKHVIWLNNTILRITYAPINEGEFEVKASYIPNYGEWPNSFQVERFIQFIEVWEETYEV